jgi:hypothetical protein
MFYLDNNKNRTLHILQLPVESGERESIPTKQTWPPLVSCCRPRGTITQLLPATWYTNMAAVSQLLPATWYTNMAAVSQLLPAGHVVQFVHQVLVPLHMVKIGLLFLARNRIFV